MPPLPRKTGNHVYSRPTSFDQEVIDQVKQYPLFEDLHLPPSPLKLDSAITKMHLMAVNSRAGMRAHQPSYAHTRKGTTSIKTIESQQPHRTRETNKLTQQTRLVLIN
jgi:hypothetical protein